MTLFTSECLAFMSIGGVGGKRLVDSCELFFFVEPVENGGTSGKANRKPNYLLSSKKYIVRQNFYLSFVQLRTLKHKKSSLFGMYIDARMLKIFKHHQLQTYHLSHGDLFKW